MKKSSIKKKKRTCPAIPDGLDNPLKQGFYFDSYRAPSEGYPLYVGLNPLKQGFYFDTTHCKS